MPDRYKSDCCLVLSEPFYDDLLSLTGSYRQNFRRLLCNMTDKELMTITVLCITTSQLRVPAVLHFASRLFHLGNAALPFDTASRLCKDFLEASEHDLGFTTRITFSEYLHYSIHYARGGESWRVASIIPDIYAPTTPLGRVLGAHMALDIVLMSLCQVNAKRLNQPDWQRKKVNLPALATVMRTLFHNQLLVMADVWEEFERIMVIATGHALESIRKTSHP
ncbi:hypothetical protein K2X14_00365 [Acetobacter sp. TBRC 12305]|uniref:Uncharacterized protein n=1 Tax=Acetobacter garciniae TaxID=2817435 RepID=A0A939KQG5_9PROT|nr:hypothetical protein [Acetobacter garciniae]MBO1323606.1 hypothetical protein [Acetobacter garciniae]MBX0343295.1 hypothetical protein [Acetobacter garciniae]